MYLSNEINDALKHCRQNRVQHGTLLLRKQHLLNCVEFVIPVSIMEVNANTQFKTCNTKNYIVTDTVLHGSLFSKEACIQVAQKNKAGQAVFCIAHSYG